MKKFFSKMFEESGDDISLMRVITFLALLMGFTIAMYGIYKGVDLNALAVLVSSFIAPAIMGKTISKFAEKDENKDKKDGQ